MSVTAAVENVHTNFGFAAVFRFYAREHN